MVRRYKQIYAFFSLIYIPFFLLYLFKLKNRILVPHQTNVTNFGNYANFRLSGFDNFTHFEEREIRKSQNPTGFSTCSEYVFFY